jgi:hypothetical protein
MNTTWTNGHVSLTRDLIFGLCVLTTNGWLAIAELTAAELQLVQELVSHDPAFPWTETLYA